MIYEDETYAYFYFENFSCNFSEITQTLGINPTHAWNKNDLNERGRQEKFSSWLLYSQIGKSDEFLDVHIEHILNILDTNKNVFLELISKYDSGINCIGRFFTPNPAFDLSKDLIKRLSEYSITVQFDLYCNCIHCASSKKQNEKGINHE